MTTFFVILGLVVALVALGAVLSNWEHDGGPGGRE